MKYNKTRIAEELCHTFVNIFTNKLFLCHNKKKALAVLVEAGKRSWKFQQSDF